MWVRSVAWEGSFSLQLASGHKKTVSIGTLMLDADLFTELFLGVICAAEIPSIDGLEMSDLKQMDSMVDPAPCNSSQNVPLPCVDVNYFL